MNNTKSISFIEITNNIYKKEGIRGFYRGFISSSIIGTISNYIFFYQLEVINQISNNIKVSYSIPKQFKNAYIAGLLSAIITLPLWTIRLRISQLSFNKTEPITKGATVSCQLIKESFSSWTNIKSLYRGIIPTIYLSFYPSIQLTIYQTLKNIYSNEENILNLDKALVIGALSSFTTSFVIFPMSLIKAKQQQISINDNYSIDKYLYENNFYKQKYSSMTNSISTIYNSFGIKGFFRGYSPIFIRSILRGGLFFCIYENVNNKLNR